MLGFIPEGCGKEEIRRRRSHCKESGRRSHQRPRFDDETVKASS